MYDNVKIVFPVIQPKFSSVTFTNNYFAQCCLAVKSLLGVGLDKKNIICISSDHNFSEHISKQYGVISYVGPSNLPPEMLRLTESRPKCFFFYKCVALKHCLPEPPDSKTITVVCDVDGVWLKNPTQFFLSRTLDVWSIFGKQLPLDRKLPSKADITHKSLKKYYNGCGGGGQAYLHLKYGWPLPKSFFFSGVVAIAPRIYAKLIDTWYNMSIDVVQRPDFQNGDQEVLSAAAWHLKASYEFAKKRGFDRFFHHDHTKTRLITWFYDRFRYDPTDEITAFPV